ncbi:hypothetical protein [Leifsonia shinshuensis]|uniref:hypothetical protein n=1 Tax=Leifsonia TaxID=110932 RepID=UPI00285DE274|nr:hypothetical protein [Leifsonia shinshuensis]MDR6972378.1 hypothetical protein [Leifsonia shinshuensis]
MTTLGHGLRTAPTLGTPSEPVRRRARGLLAAVTGNAYLQLAITLLLIAAGMALLLVGIGFVLDIAVPWVFGDELRALKVLLPQLG